VIEPTHDRFVVGGSGQDTAAGGSSVSVRFEKLRLRGLTVNPIRIPPLRFIPQVISAAHPVVNPQVNGNGEQPHVGLVECVGCSFSDVVGVAAEAHLKLVDCKVQGSAAHGISCAGRLELLRVEISGARNNGLRLSRGGSSSDAVLLGREPDRNGEATLVECTVRDCRGSGVVVMRGACLTLQGGSVSGSGQHGVLAAGGKVVVGDRSEGGTTTSRSNGGHDWAKQMHVQARGEIVGVKNSLQQIVS